MSSSGSHSDACPACGQGGPAPVVRLNGAAVFRCAACDFRFTSPRPARATLEQFYDHRHYTLLNPDIVTERLALGRQSMAHRLDRARGLTGRPLRRMLEVGSGPGFYVHGAAALGLDAHGIDLDPGAVEFGRSLGLQLSQAAIEDTGYPAESFDLILLAQIIEHVPDPHDFLSRVFRLLAPGGLVIVETPNAASPEHIHRRLFADAYGALATDNPDLGALRRGWLAATRPWGYLDPPRHINGFTPESLRRVLERAGFVAGLRDHHLFRESAYSPLSSVEKDKVRGKDEAFERRLRTRALPVYLAYRGLWQPAMAGLKAWCRATERGIGLVWYATRPATEPQG